MPRSSRAIALASMAKPITKAGAVVKIINLFMFLDFLMLLSFFRF